MYLKVCLYGQSETASKKEPKTKQQQPSNEWILTSLRLSKLLSTFICIFDEFSNHLIIIHIRINGGYQPFICTWLFLTMHSGWMNNYWSWNILRTFWRITFLLLTSMSFETSTQGVGFLLILSARISFQFCFSLNLEDLMKVFAQSMDSIEHFQSKLSLKLSATNLYIQFKIRSTKLGEISRFFGNSMPLRFRIVHFRKLLMNFDTEIRIYQYVQSSHNNVHFFFFYEDYLFVGVILSNRRLEETRDILELSVVRAVAYF